MADIKISQLGAAIAVGDTDLVPIVSGGNTLKATAAQVKEHSIGNTNISSIGDGSVTGAINALNTDKQPKTLATPLTIGGVSKTTVEDALGGLVSENQTLTNLAKPLKKTVSLSAGSSAQSFTSQTGVTDDMEAIRYSLQYSSNVTGDITVSASSSNGGTITVTATVIAATQITLWFMTIR